MTIKKSIPPQDMIDLISGVIDLSSIDGEYFPALFSYAFRVATIKFFSDYEFEKDEEGLIVQDTACRVAFEDGIFEEIINKSPQVFMLRDACKEQIQLNQERYKIELSVEKQLQRLLSNLEGIFSGASDVAKTLNPKAIGKLVERLGSIDDKSIINAITDEQTKPIDIPKTKRGRKPGSKNKSKDDKIIHIPGQMSVEDITETIE